MRRGYSLFLGLLPAANAALSFLPESLKNSTPPLTARVIPTAFHGKENRFFPKKPFLDLEQKTRESFKTTDHRAYLIDMGCGKVLDLNWLMRMCFGKNGFGIENETREEYQARLIYISQIICDIIRENEYKKEEDKIIALLGEEFANQKVDIQVVLNAIINEKIPGWENLEMHVTDFGLMACFKSGAIRNAFYFNEDLAKKLGEYAIRCHVFDTSDVYSLAHAHIPFKLTEAVFKKIIRLFIESKMTGSDDRLKMIDFIGDKNLSPDVQARLTEEVFNEMRAERIVTGKKPITVISYIASSPDGHQQMIDGKPVLTNVDSIQRIVFFESEEYAFHHVSDKNSPQGTYRRLLALLLGSTSVAAYTSILDESLTAQVGSAILSI